MTELSITEFLTQRWNEIEHRAQYAMTRDPVDSRSPGGWGGWWYGHYAHYSRHDPAYVLVDIAAKRHIVEWYERTAAVDDYEYQQDASTLRQVLELLAAPFASHPDYREEWKP